MEGENPGWQDKLKHGWGGLGLPQRIAIIGGVVVALALALYAVILAQTPDYATLFSGLSEQDAASIVEQLKALKTPYQLAQGGSAIQVPQRDVYDIRLQMAKQGLPKGSTVGFELFDGGAMGNLGMTDFMQRLQYQRALEGELARTIGSLDPVAGARVHIVVPQPSLYTSEEKDATASIVVQLKPNSDLNRQQVQAVTHLVASSVEGLKPTNITVVDVTGQILSAAGSDALPATAEAGNTQLELQHSYELNLENRLQAMLDQAVGPNQAIVRVSAAFNWDQKQTNSETYAPVTDTSGIVRSEQIQEETNGAGALSPQGVPGTNSNTIPIYPAATPGATTAAGAYARRQTTRNYEVSKVVQTVTQAPGSVKHLSVAVLLDDKLPAEQATQLRTMLEAAAGIDTSRGDIVAVERIPFGATAASSPVTALVGANQQDQLVGLAKLAGLLLAILLLLGFARRTFTDLAERLTTNMPKVTVLDEERGIAALPHGTQQQLPDRNTLQTLPAAESQALADLLARPEPDNRWREQVLALAAKRPEVVADLIQSWLAEG